MRAAVSRLYGRLSARDKIDAAVVVILLVLCFMMYERGKHNGEAKAKIAMVEKQRSINADTVRARERAVANVRAASDSAHITSTAANAKAESFRLRPIPNKPNLPAVLQTPANEPIPDLRPLVADLYAVIANRDTALTLERAANAALRHENALLLIERDTTAALVKSLNRQIALDVQEINELKRLKTPRFGVKTGIAIGAATAVAVDTGIRSIQKKHP